MLRSLWWYITNPPYYSEFFNVLLLALKEKVILNDNESRSKALEFCAKQAIDTETAIDHITGKSVSEILTEDFKRQLVVSKELVEMSPVKMGGSGNLSLIFCLTEHVQAKKVIETGVAYGWSSLAILFSLKSREKSILYSIDKPYPGAGNEKYVGCAVPEELQSRWKLLRLPDRKGIPLALQELEKVDLCHYDSDKSYSGRMWAYPLLWENLRTGGIFISDDVADNLAFKEFSEHIGQKPRIIKEGNDHYVGVLVK